MKLAIFSIVARNYLSLALTLGDSVARHHPEASFTIFVVDGLQGLPRKDYAHRLVDVASVLGHKLQHLRFQYNVTEYCTAVKPFLFQHLFTTADAEHVHYLDPDTLLFDRLDAIQSPEPSHAIYLAPHLLECRLDESHAYPEFKHLWEGIFNLGYCGLRNTPESARFLAWWGQRLARYCYSDHVDGLHTDQKWADYVPVYFGQALSICPHPGLNTAHWNLHERKLTLEAGRYLVNDQALLLFHFSGFDFNGRLLCRHASAEDQAPFLSEAVLALADQYRQKVLANGLDEHIRIPYRFNAFDNGDPVTSIHRRLYRALDGSLGAADPFASDGPFHQALLRAGLIDHSPAVATGYASGSLPGLGRLTWWTHVLLKTFLRVAGSRRYGFLIKLFVKYARPEQHLFLLRNDAAPKTFDARHRRPELGR